MFPCIILVMASRLLLIWLVLVHAMAMPAMRVGGTGGDRAIGDGLAWAICAPQMPCVTEAGCCCEASPIEELPNPEPAQAPHRTAEPVAIPSSAFVAGIEPACGAVSFRSLTSEPGPEPQLRRLARLCVWRT